MALASSCNTLSISLSLVSAGAGGAGFDPTIFADFSDILGDFFGFGDLFGRRRGPRRGADLRYNLEISFEEAAFGTAVGELSGVVETSFGYHIVQPTAERPAGVQPLDDVREQIERTLQLRRAQERVVSESQRIRAELETAADLDAVAEREGLPIESRLVTREDRLTDIGASPDFLETVFSSPEGSVTPPLGLSRGMALVAVDEIVESAVAPLDEVESEVRTDILNDRARTAAYQSAERAMARHGDFDAVARAMGREVKDSGEMAPGHVLQGTGGTNPELEEALFGVAVMEGDRGVVAVPAGALAYEVVMRVPFDSYAYEESKATLREELLTQRRFGMRQAVIERLSEQQQVEFNSELIERYNG